jgi:PhzF family phenazine biosynthesis protein
VVNFYWIDAFTDGPFTGNPAAVCLLEIAASEKWMQDFAREMGISETAFAYPEGEYVHLRWFSPKMEITLCGHATLATATALFDSGRSSTGEAIRFMTMSGELRAWLRKDNGLMELDFPERHVAMAEPPEGMLAALGLTRALAVARGGEDWLLQCESEEIVRSLSPDFRALKKSGGRGICVTAKSESPGADFVSRFFAPSMGINEDPVTGSAHCYLGPWWAERLGTRELIGRQLSARGGMVHVSLKHGRAFLGGTSKILVKGNLPTVTGKEP